MLAVGIVVLTQNALNIELTSTHTLATNMYILIAEYWHTVHISSIHIALPTNPLAFQAMTIDSIEL